ncbi:hypothetical protein XENTR_v10004654 [Xenopus tropicalis]|nr:hypothetical protein XENTR_v10004654 [Xenopus tropicalis]
MRALLFGYWRRHCPNRFRSCLSRTKLQSMPIFPQGGRNLRIHRSMNRMWLNRDSGGGARSERPWGWGGGSKYVKSPTQPRNP